MYVLALCSQEGQVDKRARVRDIYRRVGFGLGLSVTVETPVISSRQKVKLIRTQAKNEPPGHRRYKYGRGRALFGPAS